MKNQSKKFYLSLVVFSLVGQIAWVMENMYFNVFIYKMFNASAEAISAMVAASAVSAPVTTILVGALILGYFAASIAIAVILQVNL